MKNVSRRWEYILYKIFWIFLIGGVVGYLIETIWCYFDFGGFSSRTSNLFFPISLVWGLGLVVVCIFLRNNKWNFPLYIFLKGTLLCGVFEFLCGYVCQLFLGVTFWDYTELALHMGPYINVTFCLAWGILSVAWVKWFYPAFNHFIEKILCRLEKKWTITLLSFLMATSLISGLALLRMRERQMQMPPTNFVEEKLDQVFPDRILQMYFPKMKDADTGEKISVLE